MEKQRRFEGPNGAQLIHVTTPEETNGEMAVYERLMKPRTGRADPHVHFDFEQRFDVLEGRARLTFGEDVGTVAAGEGVTIPPGVTHVDAWNDTDEHLRWRMTVTPAPRPFIDLYAGTLGQLMSRGELNEQDELRKLDLFAVLAESRAKSRDARLPFWLQTLVIPVAGRVARVLGHRTYR